MLKIIKSKLISSLIIILILIIVKQSFANANYEVYQAEDYQAERYEASETLMFVMDYSNSMTERINGTRKIDMAIESMEGILPRIPREMAVGLRTYGHRMGFTYWDACRASKLVSEPRRNNSREIRSALYSLNPMGTTPITYSLKQAVMKDLAGVKGEKRIILLTDGGENCDESPCEYALELIKTRQDIKIDVIAFDLYDEEAKEQLMCVALATSGKFYSAKTAGELVNSIEESLNIQKEVQGTIIRNDK